ncbi:hypothetical protein C492_09470 [Natronococcus jeotgali DSM 18795]|uniref:Uncharacterized protein n=1 Tax=Natronococcus jeotgali DSM 18795 TaxID=1227498 RepID=L9XJG1_9EURY|nr:hypothetical protein C492_09470 [Natronococcus jeotgali DSM 18795]
MISKLLDLIEICVHIANIRFKLARSDACVFDILHTTEVVGFLTLGIGHADHPDGGNFPAAVAGPGL